MMPRVPVSSAERRWVLWFAVLVMLATSLPYAVGFVTQGEARRFTGFVFGVEDGNSYIAKMLSGANGAWLFRTPYTAYPQAGVLMFLPYILLGKLVAPPGTHEQLAALYHLFRFGAGMLAVLATYDFLAYFLKSVRVRRFGLALTILGGGLGWVLVILGQEGWLGSLPLEFYSPETFGFLGLYGIPHLALGRALLLWALLRYLRAVEFSDAPSEWVKSAVEIAGLWFLAGIVQPLATLVIGAVIALHLAGLVVMQAARQRRGETGGWVAWRRLALLASAAGILPGLLVLYNVWMMQRDPFLRMWTAQNIIRSPHPLHYLLAFGLLLPFAWVGGRRILRADACIGWLLVGWALALPVLAYLPIDLQRRLPEGEWVAWMTLALIACETSSVEESRPGAQAAAGRRSRWPLAPLLLLFPSTLFLLLGGFLAASRPALPVFRSAEEVEVFRYLEAHVEPGAVVLEAYETGNALPAWAPVRVVIGHGPESVNLAELRPQVQAFYGKSTTDAQRLEWLEAWGVSYVFWGPAERALGGWDPAQAAYLRLEDEVGEYRLYRVEAVVW